MEMERTGAEQPAIKTPAFKISLENGISRCIYYNDLIVDVTIASEMTKARLQLCGTTVCPALVDARQGTYITNSARIFLAGNEANENVSATAFLISHHVMNILFTTMLRLKICKTPARIFTNERAALQWLEGFKEKKAGPTGKRLSLLLF